MPARNPYLFTMRYPLEFGEGGYRKLASSKGEPFRTFEGILSPVHGGTAMSLELLGGADTSDAALYAAFVSRAIKRPVMVEFNTGKFTDIYPANFGSVSPLDDETASNVIERFATIRGAERLSHEVKLEIGAVALDAFERAHNEHTDQ